MERIIHRKQLSDCEVLRLTAGSNLIQLIRQGKPNLNNGNKTETDVKVVISALEAVCPLDHFLDLTLCVQIITKVCEESTGWNLAG